MSNHDDYQTQFLCVLANRMMDVMLFLRKVQEVYQAEEKDVSFCFVLTNRMMDVIFILRKVQEVYQAEEKDVAILFCANKQNGGFHIYP